MEVEVFFVLEVHRLEGVSVSSCRDQVYLTPNYQETLRIDNVEFGTDDKNDKIDTFGDVCTHTHLRGRHS